MKPQQQQQEITQVTRKQLLTRKPRRHLCPTHSQDMLYCDKCVDERKELRELLKARLCAKPVDSKYRVCAFCGKEAYWEIRANPDSCFNVDTHFNGKDKCIYVCLSCGAAINYYEDFA